MGCIVSPAFKSSEFVIVKDLLIGFSVGADSGAWDSSWSSIRDWSCTGTYFHPEGLVRDEWLGIRCIIHVPDNSRGSVVAGAYSWCRP